MVYKIVWTLKALETYLANMQYLEATWPEKVMVDFVKTVEKKLILLSEQPNIGSSRNNRQQNLRHTVLHKRVSLI